MVCIFCGGDTKVTNSRWQKRANHVWRRRQCQVCHKIFTTGEAPVLDTSIKLQGRGKSPEPFIAEILLVSIYQSLRHRPQAPAEAAALLQTVLGRLLPQIAEGSLQRQQVVATTSQVLKRFDRAATTSYLAFHHL
jgi:transcriptional regulator NrdR family protein